MLFYANSLIVIEFCHDSIKKIHFLYFRCGRSGDYLTVFRPALPPIHPRFSAYSCSIEVRLMYVCCPFINRITIGQQSNNNRTTMGRQLEKERRKGLGRVEQNWRSIGDQLEVNWRTIREQLENN